MNLKSLTNKVRETIEARGGTDRLKQDASRLKDIASGPGTLKDKAKAGGEVLMSEPAAADAPPQDPSTDPVAEGGPPVDPPRTQV